MESQRFLNEIITPWGLCFTFNMAHSHDLLNLNQVSDNFHYQYTIQADVDYTKYIYQLAETIPKKVLTTKLGLTVTVLPYNEIYEQVIENDFDGYLFIIHDPYELPSWKSKIVKAANFFETKVQVSPKLHEIDESLYGYTPAE